MADLKQVGGMLWLIVFMSAACLGSTSCEGVQNDDGQLETAEEPALALPSWTVVKKGLQENRHSMCSFLLLQVSDKQIELTLDRVTELFEQALDHMAKSVEYSTSIRPYIKADTIEEFDRSGGATVLQISDERRALIEEYRRAVAEGLSQPDKAAILERYFLKACAHKLATVIAERSMYSSLLKVETIIERKASESKRRLPYFTSFMRRRQDAAGQERQTNPVV